MKLKFWDILASIIMLAGLILTVLFINIYVNPYSFLNPFPPPTKVPTMNAAAATATARSLPDVWTVTPVTPGVPSFTSVAPATVTPVSPIVILPTRTLYRSPTRTPNWALTYYAYQTATRTKTASTDTTPPTAPGIPFTNSPTNDSTPTWYWNPSGDTWSGFSLYQVAWGGDIDCNNNVWAVTTNTWTAPTLTSNTYYYICVRARDNAGNFTGWIGPSGFFYSGGMATSTFTSTATRTFTSTVTRTATQTSIYTSTSTSTSTNTLVPTATFTGIPTSTFTTAPTSTFTLAPTSTFTGVPTATFTTIPTQTFTVVVPTNTDTVVPTNTDTVVPTFTDTVIPPTPTDTLIPPTPTDTLIPPTPTDTLIPPTPTDTLVPAATATFTEVPPVTNITISGNVGVGPTATPAGEPVPAVSITVTGDPGAVVTGPDGMGNYSVVVPVNWSGTITPSRIGFKFSPVKYTYANINANTGGQDFVPEASATFTISGNIGAAPGSTVSADNGAVVTLQPEIDGNYSVVVYSGWSGTIKVTNPVCTFTPPQYDYAGVGGDLIDQNFNPACP